MKNKIVAYAVVPAMLGFGMLGASAASAHGLFGGMRGMTTEQLVEKQSSMFSEQAKILGISESVVKDGWARGLTMREIAKENGITDEQLRTKMQAAHEAQIKAHLSAMVSNGVITQTQADSRLKAMQERLASGKQRMGKGFGRMHGLE